MSATCEQLHLDVKTIHILTEMKRKQNIYVLQRLEIENFHHFNLIDTLHVIEFWFIKDLVLTVAKMKKIHPIQ